MALFISPPFGNYFFLPYTTPIRGSFTLEPRKGLLKQILKTLRYSWKHKGWVNKINLWGVYPDEKFNMPFYQFFINEIMTMRMFG